MSSEDVSFESAVLAHDRALSGLGQRIWVGAEPTFTLRTSESPEWLSEALGAGKQDQACRLIQRLRDLHPNAVLLRTLGRQYPGEPKPRWSLGLYWPRDGTALAADLPIDPLGKTCDCQREEMRPFWSALTMALDGDGWSAIGFELEGQMELRILFRDEPTPLTPELTVDPRTARTSPHEHAIPPAGLVDDLAADGLYLVTIGCAATGPDGGTQPCLELPGFPRAALFVEFVSRVARAARTVGLERLVWRGFPPPVDETVAWATLTPDPAVIEINGAPVETAAAFLSMSRDLYRLAQAEGLSPYRLQYNGKLSDSGGGGQFTLGGPQPASSPFFLAPQLLPRLIAYLNRHPALSYWFAPACVGSFSQSPRPDENVLESFAELQVALQQLARQADPAPEFIWRSLSPFLVDTSGNAHRSELNIEKLWNPWLPGRGRLGLVEFRAFRMPIDPETATSIAMLLRALAAMLSRTAVGDNLVEWGRSLHDRFALPYYLRRDLGDVFDDLAAAGLGLGAPVTQRLLADDWCRLGRTEFCGVAFGVDQAIEFWPLLGDATQYTGGGSRLVDASTSRLQVLLRPLSGRPEDLHGWQLFAGGYRVPLREERDLDGTLALLGLRYRAFVPWTGLHPGIGAQTPVSLTLVPPAGSHALRITLHDWQPQGLPYDGLPDSFSEARRRVEERFVLETIDRSGLPAATQAPVEAINDYCLDLRRC